MTDYAQMTNVKALRPIPTFEGLYQGQPGTIPIAFPGTLDPLAGTEGHDPNLLAGVETPLGSRMLVLIPMTIDGYASEPNYGYQFLWRLRNQQAYQAAAVAGRTPPIPHISAEAPGRAEIEGTGSEPLYFIPGSSDVEIFEQEEPVTDVPALLNIRQQTYVPKLGNSWVQPLTVDGRPGVWQQGAYQYTSNVNCSGPTWFPLWLDVGGDELTILVYKLNTDEDWDFAGPDKAFSNTYGTDAGGLPLNPNIGILLSTGSMGS